MYNERDIILSTSGSLDGYRIIRQCGVVFGETVFKHSFLDTLSASISNTIDSFSLRGKEMSGSVDLIETAREHAYQKMIKQALRRNANAIIAIESDNTIGNNIMYISLYGTAVEVMKEEEYAKYKEEEARKKELAQKEREKREALLTQRLKEYQSMENDSSFNPSLVFIAEISQADSYVEIGESWNKHGLSIIYPDIDRMIQKKISFERSYGKSAKDTKLFIQQLVQQLVSD